MFSNDISLLQPVKKMQIPCRMAAWGKLSKNKGIEWLDILRFEESLSMSDKNLVKLPGEWSRFPAPYHPSIQGGNRHDLHGGIAEEAFLCTLKRLDPKPSFVDRDVFLLGQGENDPSGDAIQNAASKSWGAEAAGLYEKHIADGAFGDVRLPIQQDAIKRACGDRFPFCLDIV